MMALGAINTKRGRTGDQLAVVRRLVVFYRAVLITQRENPAFNITSHQFYTAALLITSDQDPNVSKNLSPGVLCLVIDLYRKTFSRSRF
jgi:hypothetical protein